MLIINIIITNFIPTLYIKKSLNKLIYKIDLVLQLYIKIYEKLDFFSVLGVEE